MRFYADELSTHIAGIDALRPFTELQMERLWPQWKAEDALYVYATNAIEGSTMTLGETTVVLEAGVTIGGKTIGEHLDIISRREAYRLRLEIARSKQAIDTDVVFALHRAVVGEHEWAGKWRNGPVYLRGSMHVPPNWLKVARLMDEALERYQESARTVARRDSYRISIISRPGMRRSLSISAQRRPIFPWFKRRRWKFPVGASERNS